MKTFAINLDKNTYKWKMMITNNKIPMERFSAIVGKDVDTALWLNAMGKSELDAVEKQGYRTSHYQLTRGAIGCFLSHYTLAKKLIADSQNEIYFILEDDVIVSPTCLIDIKTTLEIAPPDWDMILLGTHRMFGTAVGAFTKVSGFWGMYGYLLNKKGAKAFVEMVDKVKIDAQVDAYLSWMAQLQKFSIYATKKHIVFNNNVTNETDIQIRLIEKIDVNPYIYKGLRV